MTDEHEEREERNSSTNDLSGNVSGNVFQAGWVGSVHIVSPPPAPRTPWQVPPQTPGFVDREPELGRVLALLDRAVRDHDRNPDQDQDSRSTDAPGQAPGQAPDPAEAVTVLLSGPPGVGTSELSRRIAALTRDRFPDGQVYVPCATYRRPGGSIDLGEVYRVILSATGTADEAIPASTQERGAAYRSFAHGRRMLVVLDDAELAIHVRALTPGERGALVVTSRSRLEQLRGGRVLALAIEPLSTEAGAALVAEHIGPDRAAAEPGPVAELVGLCGGLPVALRAVCAALTRRPRRTVAEVVAQLRDTAARSRRLEHAGAFAAFDETFGLLSETAARLYVLLGLMPGPDTSAEALGAAAGLSPDDVDDGVDELIAVHLLDEGADGRLVAHGLVKLHAARLAEGRWTETERTAASRRAVAWHLRRGRAADLALAPVRLRMPGDAGFDTAFDTGAGTGADQEAEPTDGGPAFADDAAALAWLEAHHGALADCVRIAAEHGWNEAAWLLCDPLWALYQNRKHYAEWIITFRLAVGCAEKAGADWVRARLLCLLARAHTELKEFDEAFECLATALELAAAGPDRLLEASVLEFTGNARLETGQSDAALDLFAAALAVVRASADSPDARRAALLLRYLTGRALNRARRSVEAAATLSAVYDEVPADDPRLAGRVGLALADALVHSGEPARARDLALRAAHEAGRRDVALEQARALDLLAECETALGDVEKATQYTQAAREIRQALAGASGTGS